MSDKNSRLKVKTDDLNFIIAVCAILISAASFYATYLQAESAKQQVKAMTYPYVQFWHSNFDEENEQNRLEFSLKNAGVGPAIVKSINFRYEGQDYATVNDLLKACCLEEFKQQIETFNRFTPELSGGEMVSSQVVNRVMPMMEQVDFLGLTLHPKNKPLWYKLNKERWNAEVTICYCSILEQCYLGLDNGEVKEIERCPVP